MVCKGGRARQAVYMEQWLKTASQGSHVVLENQIYVVFPLRKIKKQQTSAHSH